MLWCGEGDKPVSGTNAPKNGGSMKQKGWIVVVVAASLLALVGGVAWAADREITDPEASARQTAVRQWHDYVVQGAVVATDGTEMTVERDDGELVTVQTGEDTRYWLPGSPVTDTLTLEVGDPVLVVGQPQAAVAGADTLGARLVVVVEREELPRYLMRGRAVAVTSQTLVVATGQRERAATILPRTQLLSPGGRLGALRDVRPGDQVLAVGQPTRLGQWHAGLVLVTGGGASTRRVVRGEIAAIDLEEESLSVQSDHRGEVTIVVGARTRYRIPGIDDPALSDLRAGDRIAAIGRVRDAEVGSLAAWVIARLPE
jgi:hypothetical protein